MELRFLKESLWQQFFEPAAQKIVAGITSDTGGVTWAKRIG